MKAIKDTDLFDHIKDMKIGEMLVTTTTINGKEVRLNIVRIRDDSGYFARK